MASFEPVTLEKGQSSTTGVSDGAGKTQKGLWAKLGAEEGHETQRGMHSRHLMMIGMRALPNHLHF